MSDNGPAAKRARLHRTCKSKTSKKDAKRKTRKTKTVALKMMDMNNDCLFEMMERMELRDLCTMAEVCVRLKKLAQQFFVIKYRQLSLTQLADTSTGHCTLQKICRLFYHFGHLIKSLTIDYKIFLNDDDGSCNVIWVFSCVRKYCFDTINEVTICYDRTNNNYGINDCVNTFIAHTFGAMMFFNVKSSNVLSGDDKTKLVFQRSMKNEKEK